MTEDFGFRCPATEPVDARSPQQRLRERPRIVAHHVDISRHWAVGAGESARIEFAADRGARLLRNALQKPGKRVRSGNGKRQ